MPRPHKQEKGARQPCREDSRPLDSGAEAIRLPEASMYLTTGG